MVVVVRVYTPGAKVVLSVAYVGVAVVDERVEVETGRIYIVHYNYLFNDRMN